MTDNNLKITKWDQIKLGFVYFRPKGDQIQGLIDLWNCIDIDVKEMVEVGSAYGESVNVWSQLNKEMKIHCVDTWGGQKGGGVEKNYGEIAFKVFSDRILNNKNIIVVREKSIIASKNFSDNSLDFVYIDANHSYKCVTGDLDAWYPKVRVGGYVGGHDYKDKFIESKTAINDFFGSSPLSFCDGSWLKMRI